LAVAAEESELEKRKLQQQQLKLVLTQKRYPSYLISKSTTKMVMPVLILPARTEESRTVTVISSLLGSDIFTSL